MKEVFVAIITAMVFVILAMAAAGFVIMGVSTFIFEVSFVCGVSKVAVWVVSLLVSIILSLIIIKRC